MIEQEWIDGVTGLLDEYVELLENPLYWDQKAGFSLRARKIEIENSIGDKGARWLRTLLWERRQFIYKVVAGSELAADLIKLCNKADKKLYVDDVMTALFRYQNEIELAAKVGDQ